jgi:hypothetical protein
MARTRRPPDWEPWPLVQARQNRDGTAGGCQNLGPGRQVVSQDNQRRQPISRSGRDPGHRPYARTRPNPRKQSRKHTPTSSLPNRDDQLACRHAVCRTRRSSGSAPMPSGGRTALLAEWPSVPRTRNTVRLCLLEKLFAGPAFFANMLRAGTPGDATAGSGWRFRRGRRCPRRSMSAGQAASAGHPREEQAEHTHIGDINVRERASETDEQSPLLV